MAYRAPMHRALATIGLPAHAINRLLEPALKRIGLGALPGALLVALALAALASVSVFANLRAYEARPEPLAAEIGQIVESDIASGLWVEFDARLLAGPQRAIVQLSEGFGFDAGTVERVYYLVGDPERPDQAVVIRTGEPSPAIEQGDPVRLDGTITEDPFNMGRLLEEWDLSAVAPGAEFNERQLIALGFETPFVEPSWAGAILLGGLAFVIVAGLLIPDPLFRPAGGAEPERGPMPVHLAVHGSLPTPHGPMRATGQAARLEWLAVEDVARTRWRYWGAGLGDVRRDVEEAVRAEGHLGERLVVHGSAGSVLWPVDDATALELERGTAFSGRGATPAIRFRSADGVAAGIMTFADGHARDRAFAELLHARSGSA